MRYQEFIDFAADQLDLDQVPEINIDDSGLDQTFGHYSDHGITVSSKARHPADVMRTIAHELVHYKQDQLGQLDQDSGATGSDEENQANAQAGVIMRNYSRENPDIYESQLDELHSTDRAQGREKQQFLGTVSAEPWVPQARQGPVWVSLGSSQSQLRHQDIHYQRHGLCGVGKILLGQPTKLYGSQVPW